MFALGLCQSFKFILDSSEFKPKTYAVSAAGQFVLDN